MAKHHLKKGEKLVLTKTADDDRWKIHHDTGESYGTPTIREDLTFEEAIEALRDHVEDG